MIRKIINIIPAFFFTMIALVSCTAPIDINTRDSEPVIVIYGIITDEYKYQYIRITSSSPYFDEKANLAILNAKVSVTSSTGDKILFIGEKDGYYISEKLFEGIPGVTYHLEVEVDFNNDGFTEIYEAETTIHPVVPFDSVDITLIDIMGYRHFSLNLYMYEPPETDNYYLFKFFINDSLSNNMISEFIVTEDEMYNGAYMSGISLYYFEDATDEKNLTAPNADVENDYFVYPGDKIRLQVLNIEKGYYNFINECISEKYGENPFFGGPPSNITTNLSNGAIGYFSGYCIQEKNTIVP